MTLTEPEKVIIREAIERARRTAGEHRLSADDFLLLAAKFDAHADLLEARLASEEKEKEQNANPS